jgi:hypothetical protein
MVMAQVKWADTWEDYDGLTNTYNIYAEVDGANTLVGIVNADWRDTQNNVGWAVYKSQVTEQYVNNHKRLVQERLDAGYGAF